MEQTVGEPRRVGYQPLGRAWDPTRPDIVQLLSTAQPRDLQPIYYGSNRTFLAEIDGGDAGCSLAVYKPARGEYPLYDFPSGTLYRREVASWLLDAILGWQIVPPTVVSRGRYGVGSLQLFIEARSEGEVTVAELRRMALLDVMLNNADRKAEHCLPGADNTLWGIDHGLTFHVQGKLRTVLWHFAGSRLQKEERADIERLVGVLARRSVRESDQLRELVSAAEWRALLERVSRLADAGCLPDPRYKPVPYRW